MCPHKHRTCQHVHNKYHKTPFDKEVEHKRRKRLKHEDVDDTDKQAYLFVHFNVEAVRHLIVLEREEAHVSEINPENFEKYQTKKHIFKQHGQICQMLQLIK